MKNPLRTAQIPILFLALCLFTPQTLSAEVSNADQAQPETTQPQTTQPQTTQPRDDSDEYAPDNTTFTPDITHFEIEPYTPPESHHTHNTHNTQEPHISPHPVDLISHFELHFAAHHLHVQDPNTRTLVRSNGFNIGFQAAFYFSETMLNGWNGLDFAFRLGHLEKFSILARVSSPWSLINSPHLNLAAGPGLELFSPARVFEPGIFDFLQPLVSLRLGIAAGPLILRTEYDFHILNQTHHLRTYLPLPFHIGLGIELAFNRHRSPDLQLNDTAATFFIHF